MILTVYPNTISIQWSTSSLGTVCVLNYGTNMHQIPAASVALTLRTPGGLTSSIPPHAYLQCVPMV